MRRVICTAILGLLLCGTVLADIEKSIFDDDWTPSTPQVQTPALPVTPTPTPETPTPTPNIPTPPPVAITPTPSRVAVPTAAAQAEAWKLIKEELYKDEIAKAVTPAQKVTLAKKLLAVARDTKKDMVGKYVLLAQAKEIAIGSGDPPTAFKCLDEMGRYYDIDYPTMKVELFTSLSTTVNGPADCRTVALGLIRWAGGQVKSDRFDVAKSAVQLAVAVARKSGDAALLKQTGLHQTQLSEIEAAYTAIKPALVTLADKPTDPAANLALGRFYCLMKGDWERGLPMLALGSDASLKTLATLETAGVSGPDAQMAVGDGWWNLIEKEKGLAQDRIRSRAIKWYRQALPGLEGLAKAKVEKRVGSVQAAVAGNRAEKWLSKNASYTASSVHIFKGTPFPPLPSLLTGTGPLHFNEQFAFETKEGEKGGCIRIDLGNAASVTRIEVTNRDVSNEQEKRQKPLLSRAVGMKVWLSDDPHRKGKEIWTCTSGEAEWNIPVESVQARYITIGFPEDVDGNLHLKYVKVFGYEGNGTANGKVENGATHIDTPRVVDLMPLLDLSAPDAKAACSIRDGVLRVDTTGMKGVRLPVLYKPPEEYDFVIEFTQTVRMGAVNQVAYVNGKEFYWAICRNKQGTTGFVRFTPEEGASEIGRSGSIPLPLGKRHRSEVRVRRDSVAGYIDGSLVMEVKDFSQFKDQNSLCRLMTSSDQKMIFHTVQLKEITGVGKRLEPSKHVQE